MMVVMMDANYISERLNTMRREISDINTATARYWSKSQHTALEKSAKACPTSAEMRQFETRS
jgi:hypothetical protein